MKRFVLGILLLSPFATAAASTVAAAEVAGEFRVWHRLTLTFDGPSTGEGATPNPFRDYRLDVTFSKNGRQIVVPGFYAADGNAAESSASSGNKWRVHFCPDEEGTWTWSASFRTGTDIAVSSSATAGSATAFNGETGSVVIGATNKTGRDHRAQGRLRYVGRHQLQFAQTGKHFLKGGADSPENFLAFKDFDGTPTNKHAYAPHAGDWKSGDPSWKSGMGKNIIGALNYLAGKGMNSVYFLTMNVQGDGKDVWPWTSDTERHRFDCSKLDQWEIVFSHMDKLGLMLHVVTQETENDQLLDGGDLGTQRKLYYRELVARFAHHLAVTWNIGEENTNTDAQRKAFADHLHALDPYDGQVAVHTYPGQYDAVYDPLLGHAGYEGASLQMGNRNDTHAETLKWVTRSAQNGRKWAVCLDEIGPANEGVKPDADDPDHDSVRQQALWGNLMAGGAGAEWYFGYAFAHDDLDCEDWRSRAKLWDQTRWALDFFQQHLPFWEMTPSDSLTSAGWCLAKAGDTYGVYLPSGGSPSLQLPAGTWSVQWYNPRAGGALQNGSVTSVTGGGSRSLGNAPADASKDWAVLVKLSSGGGTPPPPPPGGTAVDSFTLIDADSDTPLLDPLPDGAVLNLGTLPTRNLNIRANTSPATVGSVRFEFDGNTSYRIESAAPYTIGGDSSGDYAAWTPAVGTHTLVGVPYAGAGATGAAGTSKTIGFTVIDDPTTPGTGAPPSGSTGSSGGGGSSGGACGATGLEVLIGLGLAAWMRRRRCPAPALKSTGRLLIFVALLSLPLLGAARTAPAAAGVFQESGGIVVVEIESEPTAGGWTKESSLAGYTGSGYYTWRGGDLFNSPGQGILRYQFQIQTAGTYSFRIHNRHDAADSTLENDCFTRMDGGAWVKTFSSARGAWVWNTNHEFGPDQKPAASYQLAAGLHTLEFSGRSKNFSIDRFHLYLPSVTNPTDKTRPESSTTPGGGTPPPGSPSLSSITLIDADTDQPVPGFSPLNDGAVLNLAALPTRNLNVRADPGPGAPGSVVFSLDGTPTTESSAPFSLAGDNAGDYAAWTPAVGAHVITATPYDGAGGTGAAGAPITITFTVVDAPGTPSSNPGVAVPEPDNGRDNENGDNPCSGRAVADAGPGVLLFAAGVAALALSGCRR